MGISIALIEETGGAIQTLADDKNLLHSLLPPRDDNSYPMLASIDWYGDTVFNAIQMKRFISEWDRCAEGATSPEAQVLAGAVKAMALRCQNEVHLYLKFIGD